MIVARLLQPMDTQSTALTKFIGATRTLPDLRCRNTQLDNKSK